MKELEANAVETEPSQASEPEFAPPPPPPPPPPPAEWPPPNFRTSGTMKFGPHLWIFGATLWAYVIIGEWVVNLSFPEPLAVLLVLATLGSTWFCALRQPPFVQRSPLGWAGPGLIAILACVLTLALFTVTLGTTRKNQVEALTIALWLLSLVAFAYGRYWTLAARSFPMQPLLPRGARIALWAVSGVGTLVALISATTHL